MVAYEIHHGVVEPLAGSGGEGGLGGERSERGAGSEPFLDGIRDGAVWGTIWHGAFENDGFRRAWLAEIAAAVGSTWVPRADAPGFSERRERMLDDLADALEACVDLPALLAAARGDRTSTGAAGP